MTSNSSCPYNSRLVNIFYIFLVARLAQTHISPLVREMENEGKFKESVIKMLFNNGVNILFIKLGIYFSIQKNINLFSVE